MPIQTWPGSWVTDQRISKLRIDGQAPMKFLQGRNKRLAVTALPGTVRQAQ